MARLEHIHCDGCGKSVGNTEFYILYLEGLVKTTATMHKAIKSKRIDLGYSVEKEGLLLCSPDCFKLWLFNKKLEE